MSLFLEKYLFLISVTVVYVYAQSRTYTYKPVLDITQPCRYPVAVGMEKEYIKNDKIWTTSATNSARGAQYGRLHGWKGGGAWTAGTPNNNQHLGIDLGYRMVVTSVASQGRRGSSEWVTEYYLEISSDNKTWNIYTNKYNTPLMFQGNTDDDTIVRNDMDYGVVARYIRFNPQRWHQFISMRVEVYGCRYEGESASFDSKSRITYDISGQNQFVQTRTDHLKLRFRTNRAQGLLFFADGNQGDYFILELVEGHLYFHIDLGSTATMNGDTRLRAGSLLDDNQWHDVEIRRNGRELFFTVDRLTITNMTNGEFYQLDLDRKITLGGLDNFLQPGKRLLGRHNFTGCLEDVWFNQMNMIKDTRMGQPRFKLHGAVMMGICQVDPVTPYTFPSIDTYLKLPAEAGNRLRIGLKFRTFNRGGLLFVHKLAPSGRVMMKVDSNGHLEYSVKTSNDPEVISVIKNIRLDPIENHDIFTDGLWHSLDVDVESGTNERIGRINITVDGRPDVTSRQLTFQTTTDYFIGGGDQEGGELGFLGCMRDLEIQSEAIIDVPSTSNFGVINGTCTIQDRCDPNPCEHGGVCSQDYNSFSCDCAQTGYEGGVCHKSQYLVSCEEARQLNPTIPDIKGTYIDIDDSGPLEPFKVDCKFNHETEVATVVVHHDKEERTHVDGYQEPGSYVRPINYNMIREQFDELVDRRAYQCEQNIVYECKSSRLLQDVGMDRENIPSWGWWVGRTNLNMRYWGGSSPGSGKCACALKDECANNEPTCNCDAGLADIRNDNGLLYHKEHLPVMELRFGDTGTISDQKEGWHTLGALECLGDTLFDNVVTFRKQDATIEFPTFDAAASGDVRFQFRTTQMNGILVQNTGAYDFIEVKLVFGNTIQFRFDVGNGIQTLEQTTAYPMNDDKWHTVHVERNRRQSMLMLDQQAAITHEEPTDQGFRVLSLNSNFVVGAAVDYKDGFVGCMRALMVNGKVMDLRGAVERGEYTYGISVGCNPKCASSPCFNDGICMEWYSHYVCDCAYTPYRGWDCGREVGVNMQPNYMIKYEFDQETGDIATDEETIIIGFATQEKKGTLMLIRNDDKDKPEYISIEMNNNGGVKVALDLGFERDEVNNDIQGVDLANSQQHVATVRRYNKGRSMVVTVDDYPPLHKHWTNLPDSADTKLDKPRYIYYGRNETTRPGDGFKGCLFRSQFDNLYPLKRVFQDPRPANLYLEPSEGIREDMCGFEEVTHRPELPEFRPTPTLPMNMTTQVYAFTQMGPAEQALLGAILGVVFLLIIGIIFLLGRYISRHKGEYKTYEAKDTEYYDNADYAIAAGASGQPEVPKKKEWFI